jgi:transposase
MPYSMDLRVRVVGAVRGGVSCRQAAARFGVGISTAILWMQRYRATGSVAPGQVGGDRRSRLKGEREWLLARIAEKPDLTLQEVRAELAARGLQVGHGTVWRFFAKEGISFKKNRARLRARQTGRGAKARKLAEAPSKA